MSQANVLELIEKHKGLTAKEISRILKISKSPINNNLLKLFKQGAVQRKLKPASTRYKLAYVYFVSKK